MSVGYSEIFVPKQSDGVCECSFATAKCSYQSVHGSFITFSDTTLYHFFGLQLHHIKPSNTTSKPPFFDNFKLCSMNAITLVFWKGQSLKEIFKKQCKGKTQDYRRSIAISWKNICLFQDSYRLETILTTVLLSSAQLNFTGKNSYLNFSHLILEFPLRVTLGALMA